MAGGPAVPPHLAAAACFDEDFGCSSGWRLRRAAFAPPARGYGRTKANRRRPRSPLDGPGEGSSKRHRTEGPSRGDAPPRASAAPTREGAGISGAGLGDEHVDEREEAALDATARAEMQLRLAELQASTSASAASPQFHADASCWAASSPTSSRPKLQASAGASAASPQFHADASCWAASSPTSTRPTAPTGADSGASVANAALKTQCDALRTWRETVQLVRRAGAEGDEAGVVVLSPGDVAAEMILERRCVVPGAESGKHAAVASPSKGMSDEPVVIHSCAAEFVLPRGSAFVVGDVFGSTAASAMRSLQDLSTAVDSRPAAESAGGPGWNLVVMDPPWPSKSAARARAYTTWSDVASARRHLKRLALSAELLAPGAIVAVWCTHNEAVVTLVERELLSRLECDVVARWEWLKLARDGEPVLPLPKLSSALAKRGRWPTERLLIGRRRGLPLDVLERLPPLPPSMLFTGIPLLHSAKPPLEGLVAQYCAVVEGDEARKLELFARRVRPQWLCIGDECLVFNNSYWLEREGPPVDAAQCRGEGSGEGAPGAGAAVQDDS